MKIEWNGEGYPPIGAVVELARKRSKGHISLEAGTKVEVVARIARPVGEAVLVVWRGASRDVTLELLPNALRPYRTEEDKLLEELCRLTAKLKAFGYEVQAFKSLSEFKTPSKFKVGQRVRLKTTGKVGVITGRHSDGDRWMLEFPADRLQHKHTGWALEKNLVPEAPGDK